MNKLTILERLHKYASQNGDRTAVFNPCENPSGMTYKELYCRAVKLAEYLNNTVNDTNPIVVYGHKNPYSIVSFLACVLSGHSYCPVDVSVPDSRIDMILNQTQSGIVLATEEFYSDKTGVLDLKQIVEICSCAAETVKPIPKESISGDQTFYIIFTSGSTGNPKGVEITSNNLNNFLSWSSTLGDEKPYDPDTVFLNQAPFSFDLSVMDLYTSLYCGSRLCMMEKKVQADLGAITPFLRENKISAFVSTPSFANMCLVDKNFNSETLPELTRFFFCGETLENKTASKLIKRFPTAVIQNTYGPTESTVAVSSVRITEEIIERYDPLPVGYPKENTDFIISEPVNNIEFENGHKTGEILITGDTLAKGYFGRKDLTDKAFVLYDCGTDKVRAYRTGDLGYLDKGQLFYKGRIDLQIKLNGYRIEIGDIESSILKNEIVSACAVIPRINSGKVKSLAGVVVLTDVNIEKSAAKEKIISELKKLVPPYMIPQNYIFLNVIPMTDNGKVDRKKLISIIEEN